jgi:copper resistance protein C
VTSVPCGRRPSGSGTRRILLVLIGAVVALVVASGPAAAHTELISTTPADQQTVSHTPAVVVLTFDESLLAMGTQVVVTGPQGPVQIGEPNVAETTVSQNVQGGPAGTYSVAWRVTAADGHPLSGTFTFTAAEAGNGVAPTLLEPGESGKSDDNTTSSGRSTWMWLLGGIAFLTVLVTLTRKVIRRSDVLPPS